MRINENVRETRKKFPYREVIVCDFDGTVTEEDVCDEIMKEFGSSAWRDIGEQYVKGIISHEAMNKDFVTSLKISPEELIIFLKQKIEIREGFLKFLAFCQQHDILPIIVSGGWDFYIRAILKDVNLYFVQSVDDLSSISIYTVPVICNNLLFNRATNSWQIKFSAITGCQNCTPNKKNVIDYLRSCEVKNIIVVGDGTSDYDLARAADFVFSRNGLTKYCEHSGVSHLEFFSFIDIFHRISEIKNRTIRVLSLPSYHPYNKRFDNQMEIVFINPDCDFFADERFCMPEYLDKHFPPNTYDVVHFHFEYYLITLEVLEIILQYFKNKGKPIIWTCHDRSSLLEEKSDIKHEKMLFENADAVITLTLGCSRWLHKQFGRHRGGIEVIPLGYMAHPAVVESESKRIKKDRNLFTMHVGDFRKSKDYIQSIRDFLSCSQLANVRLQVIFRPINIYPNDNEVRCQMETFSALINHPRIIKICMPHIPDDVLIRAFLASHAVILPYKWGTHSGQLELARDCGSHVVVSDVGFYKEQWDKIFVWTVSDGKKDSYTHRYQQALIKAYNQKPLESAGYWRKNEFEKIIKRHVKIYKKLIYARDV